MNTKDEDREEFLEIASLSDPNEKKIDEIIEWLRNEDKSYTLVLSERLNDMKFKILCDSYVNDISCRKNTLLHILKFQRFLSAERASNIRYKFPDKDVEKYNVEYYINIGD